MSSQDARPDAGDSAPIFDSTRSERRARKAAGERVSEPDLASPMETAHAGLSGPSPDISQPTPLDTEPELCWRVIEQAGLPILIINGAGKIVRLSAAAGRFLTFSTGWLTNDLLEVVHPALREPLNSALERTNRTQRQNFAVARLDLGDGLLTVCARMCPLGRVLVGHTLVSLEAQPALPSALTSPEASAGSVQAQREVERLRADLAGQITQRLAAEEKHQTDTGELQAMNEELRLASEELEAGKEQLQAANEELADTNRTLETKVVELGRANGDLQNLMAATEIASVFLDREGCITRFTPAATTLFCLATRDLGRPLVHLNHHLNYAELAADTTAVLTHLQPVEREISRANGEWFLVRLLPYRTINDQIAGVVLSCVNITERKQADTDRLAKEAAERINQARSEFLSRMSHELRTPLNAILGFGQILELSSRDEQDRHALELILKAGRHLLSLVDEVLDLTHAEEGKLRLVHSEVNLDRLTRECVQLTARLAQSRQVTCQVNITDGPASLWTDEQRLRQALLNLLTNAIKYNRPGGQITILCSREMDTDCLIEVRDTGCGIVVEDIPRLFMPFERLHHHDSEIEGPGLGLAITRQLIEALGGTVGAESEPGQGSRFWIKMPWGQASEALLDSGNTPPHAATNVAADLEGTLLCIEDNASNLRLVQMVAARHWPRWRFLTARSGHEGLEQARQHLPDLILLDLQLPDLSGEQVLAKLRGDPGTARIPAVVLSADATAHSQERLLAAGAVGYVTKPFQIGDLVHTVSQAISSVAGR